MPNITTILIAWILQSSILSGFVWFDKYRNPSKQYTCWLLRGMRGFFFIVLTTFSLIFIDTNIKILFLGIIGYGNIYLHLASLILTFILAGQIIIGAVFIAPNRKGIVTFSAVLGTFIFLWYINLPKTSPEALNLFDSKYSILLIAVLIPLLIGASVAIIMVCCEVILDKVRDDKDISDMPFYDRTKRFKSIFNWKFNIFLWALITTELILNLQGLSMFLWLTFLI
ncbi:MAG: hypothetical protein ACOC44_01080 [Promethearchaeia archaeon]